MCGVRERNLLPSNAMTSLPAMHGIRSLRSSAWAGASLSERPGTSASVLAVGASRFPDLGGRLCRIVGCLGLGEHQGGIDVEVGVTAKPVLA
jgi:hypothetical protein